MPKQESIVTRDVFAKDAECRGGKPRAFNFAIGDAVYYGYSPLRWTIKHLPSRTARPGWPIRWPATPP